jgi:cyclic beta-1,2-glucan synthetase
LVTAASLRRYKGHFFNWYDGETHEPLRPLIVSSVDSGNLVACLWTVEHGCLAQLRKPLVDSRLAEGLADHLRELVAAGVLPHRKFRSFARKSKRDWLEAVVEFPIGLLSGKSTGSKGTPDSQWFIEQVRLRVESVKSVLCSYAPWLLPKFRPLRMNLSELGSGTWQDVELERIPEFIDVLLPLLASASGSSNAPSFSSEENRLRQQLRELLPSARAKTIQLIRELKRIATEAELLADETDFGFLLSPRRKLMAVAFDTETQHLSAACYDQLASEARVATFVAIAKNDIPQESWFRLSRHHKESGGRVVLLSWGGTMFEYLMPCLWMNTYPDTLLDHACVEAVGAQRSYAARRGVPWGISESASSQRVEDGSYAYFAFGVPDLALRDSHPTALVISPYSTLLARHISPSEASRNLRKMERLGCLGPYGMYEAADFTNQEGVRSPRPEIVRLWMAHHQGMSLVAVANALCDGVVRRWFHSDPSVQATELLLQERPVGRLNSRSRRHRVAA